jgi:hypothetical protein
VDAARWQAGWADPGYVNLFCPRNDNWALRSSILSRPSSSSFFHLFWCHKQKKIFILSFFGQACVYQTNPPSLWQPLFLTIFLSSAMQGSCWKGLAS